MKNKEKQPLGFTKSRFVLDIDVDKVCDDHPSSMCMSASCRKCIDAASVNPIKEEKFHSILERAKGHYTKAKEVEDCMSARIKEESPHIPEPPTTPPVRKVRDGRPVKEDEGFTSEDKWQFSKLSFIIGVMITAALFKVFGG